MRYAELKPDLPASIFPPALAPRVTDRLGAYGPLDVVPKTKPNGSSADEASNMGVDEFPDDGLDDQDLLDAGKHVQSARKDCM